MHCEIRWKLENNQYENSKVAFGPTTSTYQSNAYAKAPDYGGINRDPAVHDFSSL